MTYYKTFEFFDTAEQAENFCIAWNKEQTPYIRKRRPAHFTPWASQDGKENKFIAWYYYKR
jgi:hypothetical protein